MSEEEYSDMDMKVWTGFVKDKYNQKSIFLDVTDKSVENVNRLLRTSEKLVSIHLIDFDFGGVHFDERTLNIYNDKAPGTITVIWPFSAPSHTCD